MDWRGDLRALIQRVPDKDLPDLVAELARADVVARQRLQPNSRQLENGIPRYLKAETVADLLGVDASWVYRHRDDLGALDLSDRCVRFAEAAVTAFLQVRAGG